MTGDTNRTGRGSNGRFLRTIEQIERDAQAARLKARGRSYREVAEEFGCTPLTAIRMVARAREQAGKADRDEYLRLELIKLDAAEQVVLEVLAANHLTVSQGKVVRLDGKPLPDDGPMLAAVDRWLKVQDQRAKLLGLYAPNRATVTVVTEDAVDAEIARLEAELAERAATSR